MPAGEALSLPSDDNRRLLFWRFINSDIGRLLVGFVLTTVVGTFLASWYSYQQWHREKEFEVIRLENEMAVVHVNDVNALLNTRLAKLRELYAAAINGNASDTPMKLSSYRASINSWNVELMLKSSIIERLFAANMHYRLFTNGKNEVPPVTVAGYFDRADREVFTILECANEHPCETTPARRQRAYMRRCYSWS